MRGCQIYNALCIHWDHHPTDASQHYGFGTDADQIRRYLREVKPDVTQVHAIGCYGYAGYPSSVAPAVPGLVGDPLQVWSRACAAEGVPFGCYAASFDCQSPQPVPQWRSVNRAGQVSTRYYCPNGPWVEEFFVPLLHEVMGRYHPVHFWLDGVWLPGNRHDYCYCPYCRERYLEQYGHLMPQEPATGEWIELQEFYEQSLDDAIRRIARAIKQHDSDVLLACNSAYFFKDARKPLSDVDWLSWDVLNTPNLHRASFESAYISTAGKPADIMIYEQGIIHWQPDLLRRPRTLAQLRIEAGTVLAHGARVNLWHDPDPDGAIPAAKADIAVPLAQFVRERQSWCIDNESASEVAVIASRLDHFINPEHQDVTVRAIQQLLQEAHLPSDIVNDDALLTRLVQYRLIILPEISTLKLDTAQWLHQYVTDGGSLLLIATEPCAFTGRWQETLLGDAVILTPNDERGGSVVWNNSSVPVGHRHYSLSGNAKCIIPYRNGGAWLANLTIGDGNIYIITGEAISEYAETHWPLLRDLVASAAREGIKKLPLAELAGHPGIELVVNHKGNDLYVHLVNLTPGNSFGAPSEVFFDEATVYRDITLTVRPPQMPTSITLLPESAGELKVVEMTECQDMDSYCTLRIQVPELQYHVAVRLAGALR